VIPSELGKQIEALGREFPGALAVFDADGTLWREDVGEAFLRHLIELGWVKLPDGSDPYAEYERRVAADRRSGYAFAAQLLAGLAEPELQAEAHFFAGDWVSRRKIADTLGVVEICAKAGLRPFVVSASCRPIVIAAAPLVGFKLEQCRGIETAVRDGKYTDELIEPITYAEGKIAAAEQHGTIAVACGDSLMGDFAMMERARLAIAVAPRGGSPLATEANRRAWPILSQDS
jgi:phosphoserine phosphatase